MRLYPRPAPRRRLLVAGLVVLALAAAGIAGGPFARDGGDDGGANAPAVRATGDLDRCVALPEDEARACYARELDAIVTAAPDPAEAVEQISAEAYEDPGGFLLPNCHGLMHTVGREYATGRGVTLATLKEYLPRTNDPGCSAGFAHGLVSAVAPDIDVARPQEAEAVLCADAATRYQRYSCTHGFGHAFMRISGEDLRPALELCRKLGAESAPDCAQGAYHDYWFAVEGLDDTTPPDRVETDPRQLCADQPRDFVRPCWYRAFVENRGPGFQTETPADIQALCEGLDGLQRDACVTAASVIGPPDPRAQLLICAQLPARDAESCIRGTKVQNLLTYPPETFVTLIRHCQVFDTGTRPACYRWLGKTLGVITDGEFATSGCPRLGKPAAREACLAGVRSMEGALVTFS